jgi:hypothetical protein
MVVDLVLQIERVQTFFLRKYLFLSQFSNIKTPTEDSRLRHKSRYQFYSTCMSILLNAFINFNNLQSNLVSLI